MSITHETKKLPPPLPMGTETPWGKIDAIYWDGFERHYLMVDDEGVVSHFPDEMVREAINGR